MVTVVTVAIQLLATQATTAVILATALPVMATEPMAALLIMDMDITKF